MDQSHKSSKAKKQKIIEKGKSDKFNASVSILRFVSVRF